MRKISTAWADRPQGMDAVTESASRALQEIPFQIVGLKVYTCRPKRLSTVIG